ncbi:cupin domain-containing protein [Oleiagrimonas sp. C23AA]|uniref:cupin domain-containing protein n=1 Tax=Oleiagrimonas sp. C23AA TaxID=2719047 RepID=UPI001421EB5C|nr:cupin domain-containing protein [Oleiagrimonas sp. C23AA]NII11660.1 cupin domain-containing protein [Oleiagrimonas sp. C23AA]
MSAGKVSLAEKFALFQETWTPKIVAQCNGQLVKLAKGEGRLVWHAHEHEDELFLVIKGELTLHLRLPDGEPSVVLGPGDMYVVPKGIEHCPQATPDTHIVLIEPASTAHTGQHQVAQTVAQEDQAWL